MAISFGAGIHYKSLSNAPVLRVFWPAKMASFRDKSVGGGPRMG